MSLDDLRQRLSAVDTELVNLIAERQKIVAEVSARAQPGVLGSDLDDLSLELAGDLAPAMASGTRVIVLPPGGPVVAL